MADQGTFQGVFAQLKDILREFEPRLKLTQDEPGYYSLDAGFSPKFRRQIFFGSAQIKKNYVSFYLMPVYMYPELLEGVSLELRKRMQGKSCFNFKSPDERLFAELALLARQGFERFQHEGLI